MSPQHVETSRLLEHPNQVQRASPSSQSTFYLLYYHIAKKSAENHCLASQIWSDGCFLPRSAVRQKANARDVGLGVCCWAMFGGESVASVLALDEDPPQFVEEMRASMKV